MDLLMEMVPIFLAERVVVPMQWQPGSVCTIFMNTNWNHSIWIIRICVLSWSFRIFASVAYGAINTAYISEYLASPTTEYIGITASDILN